MALTGDIVLEIISSHKAPGQTAQKMESSAQGACFIKDGKHHIIYEDVQNGEGAVIRNHLILSEEKMELRQKGAVRSKMLFETDRQFSSAYFTPYGEIPIEITTKRCEVTGLSDPQSNEIHVLTDYRMNSGGESMTECTMEIRIRPMG